LTIAMLTQLPILYLKKNGLSVVENRLSKYNKAYAFSTIGELNILVYRNHQNFFYTIEPVVYFNEWWDSYFITKKQKTNKVISKNKFDINIYCIYFPQFHEFTENNISFYDGFTDITNLELLKAHDKFKYIETPNLQEFDLQKITDYNLNNKNIIQKQIDIMCDYNISGLAIYYYWFSLNTITGKNQIMENVINHFFDDSINMKNRKIFFIWANEPWSHNAAFGVSNDKIETDYSKIGTFDEIMNNLLLYFKHDNYLKIDNKPVLSIHHPWYIGENNGTCFDIFNKKCIENDYNGIHFIVNAINGPYNYINNYHNFNYKRSKSSVHSKKQNQIFLDYKNYIDNDITENIDGIHTLAFDFDNSARLLKPYKLSASTICINNTEFNKILFMQKIVNKYNKSKNNNVENILLVNSWNEWGEKMHMEPSNEYGYYYLNMMTDFIADT